MSINSKMTALADEIRELSGTTVTKSIDAMTTDVDAANTEIAEQAELLEQIATALENKAAGSGGVTLPTLDNPASASDILSGKEAIDSSGSIITGTIATKTASNLAASGATVTVPAGYYASQATKSVASGSAKTPATTITKTPTISVSSSGLITASVSGTQNVTPTVTAGYVSSGTAGTITVSGSNTKQLTTQAAKTITPSTSSQTAVASGRYTTGAITVAPIPSNYEDVATETSAYTTKLASLETAIAALETELEGKASGGGGNCEILTFTCSGDTITGSTLYTNSFISGMTWREFINSPLNYTRARGNTFITTEYSASGNYVSTATAGGLMVYVSTGGTGASRVLLTDAIENRSYNTYYEDAGQ